MGGILLSIFLNGKKTPTFDSVGFLLYLCEMETNNRVFVDYGMFDDLNHRFIDEKIYEMAMDRFYAERLRHKMGGDEGVHSIVKNTEEDGD